MVTLTATDDAFLFDIKRGHKIWALKSKINIPKENLVQAYQDKAELNNWSGFRIPGTYIPYIITAGTFYRKGNRNFWDMMNKKNTIIVELKNNYYNKLYIEVENPKEMMNALNTK